MKLFPYHTPPAPVHGWHVPVPKTKLADIVDSTWDLTLQRIIPFVDGVNDVRRIAWLADVSLPLTQCALQHLLYYDTILLLDIFFFGSCYALRPGIHDFVANRANIIDECAAYVWTSSPSAGSIHTESMASSTASLHIPGMTLTRHLDPRDASTTSRLHADTASRPTTSSTVGSASVRASHYQLIKLMTTFCVGRSTMEWVRLHQEAGFDVLRHVDVRRLVQFGVVKGLLYRVHKYAVSKSYLTLLATGRRPGIELGNGKKRATEKDSNNKYKNQAKGKAQVKAKVKTKGKEKEKEQGKDKEKEKGKERSVIVAKSPGDDDGLEMKMTGRRISNLRIRIESEDGREDVESGGNGDGDGIGDTDDNDENGSENDEDDDDHDHDETENENDDDDDHEGKADRAAKTRKKMLRYLDGRHCFDQIVTEQNLTDAEILRKLKSFEPGDVAVMYR